MNVRIALWVCAAIVVMAIVTVVYGVNKTGRISIIPCLVALLVIVQQFRPVIKYNDKSVGLYNLLGMRLKKWSIDDLSVVHESGGKKVIYGKRHNGCDKKILSSGNILYDLGQSADLIAAVEADLADRRSSN